MTLFSRGLGAGVLLGTSVCCNAAMRAPPLPDAELAAVHAQYAGAPATAGGAGQPGTAADVARALVELAGLAPRHLAAAQAAGGSAMAWVQAGGLPANVAATAPTLSLSVPQLNGSLLGLFMGLAFVKAEPPPPPAGNGH